MYFQVKRGRTERRSSILYMESLFYYYYFIYGELVLLSFVQFDLKQGKKYFHFCFLKFFILQKNDFKEHFKVFKVSKLLENIIPPLVGR